VALVFTVMWLIVLIGLANSALALYQAKVETGKLSWKIAPIVIVFSILLVYLLTKLIYEEILPCATVDSKYCNFTSTQYRSLIFFAGSW
jgi:hypothetical protein